MERKIYPTDCRVPGIERTDMGAFLSEQWKETEENNRMGESRYLLKKIGDTKGTFHAKMGIIKDRNVRDLKEDVQGYTELCKKCLNDPDNHDGVVRPPGV